MPVIHAQGLKKRHGKEQTPYSPLSRKAVQYRMVTGLQGIMRRLRHSLPDKRRYDYGR